MSRKDELLQIFENVDEGKRNIVLPLIDEVVFLENRLQVLRKEPFIKYHPTNKTISKQTAAAKMYKEMLQQYNNSIKILIGILSKGDDTEVSPLREYFMKLETR